MLGDLAGAQQAFATLHVVPTAPTTANESTIGLQI